MTNEKIDAAQGRLTEACRALADAQRKLDELRATRQAGFSGRLGGLAVSAMSETFGVGVVDPAVPSWLTRLAPEVGAVLRLALREALQLGHNKIRPEHILLALIKSDTATDALRAMSNGDAEGWRRAVIRTMAGPIFS